LQVGKIGDWIIDNEGECYTCDGEVFANTYAKAEREGFFFKTATVSAVEAEADGKVKTLEGYSKYSAGDFIVTNPDGDQYPISRAKFLRVYTEYQ